ncbi:hypothetical protein [Polymorphospora sp. NPDC050346]|uniref:hypothetical protein n=1 Tax=Polymorphospora sp. NPDC050346 TaxID=3155780 RepID=UPI0033C211CA
MPEKLSKATQYTLIGDGLALGCHDLGIVAVTSKTLELELAFNAAWRDFPLATTMFAQVHASLARSDIHIILGGSPRRRWSRVAWEQHGAWWRPGPPGTLDWDDIADSIADLYGITRQRWTELAGPFARRLRDENVQRAS